MPSSKSPSSESSSSTPPAQPPKPNEIHHILLIHKNLLNGAGEGEDKTSTSEIVDSTSTSAGAAKKKISDPAFLKSVLEPRNLSEALFVIVAPTSSFKIRPVTTFVAESALPPKTD